jgi:hypothetical protein
MNTKQSMTWELLLILGIVLLLTSPVGDWLASIVREITVHHDMNLSFNPFSKTSVIGGTGIMHDVNLPAGGGGGGSGGTSLFNVPIVNASGEPGTIQVVAHDAASATGNAYQGGNTPTGSPTPA